MITPIFEREGLIIDGALDSTGAILRIRITPSAYAHLTYQEAKALLAGLSVWLTEAEPQSERRERFDLSEDDLNKLTSNPRALGLLPALMLHRRTAGQLCEAFQNPPYLNVPTADVLEAVELMLNIGLISRKNDLLSVTEKGRNLIKASISSAANDLVLQEGQQN